MKRSSIVQTLITLLVLPCSLNAATTTVYGPQKLNSGFLSIKQTQSSFAAANNANGTVSIVNGDGSDIQLETCSGNLIKKLLCTAENLLKIGYMELTRPNFVEITLNNKVIVTSQELPQTKGKLNLAIKTLSSNQLKVRIGSLLSTQSLSLEIKAETGVNQLPIARMSLNPTTGIAPELINLSGLTSTDADGSIASFSWDFGDGSGALGSLVMHQYMNPGTYVVKLTVTDDRGGVGTATQSLLIKANQLPVANFVATTKTDLGEMRLSLDASTSADSDGTIQEYRWNFGDGTAEIVGIGTSIVSLDHIFANPGTYSVSLTVKDNKSGLSTIVKALSVSDSVAPIATITSPLASSVITSSPILVSGTSNEKLLSASVSIAGEIGSWALVISSDKKSFSGSLPVASSGTKILAVSIVDLAGNQSVSSLSVVANFAIPPVAKLTIAVPASKVAPVLAHFDATESSDPTGRALTYKFNFGDGSSQENATGLATHEYLVPGIFTVTLSVANDQNVSSQLQRQIDVVQPVLPPDPKDIAPPLSLNRLETMEQRNGFLYNSANPIQTGLQANALNPTRLSVIHGQVLDESNLGIPGVKVSILEMPGLGQTLTRADGFYDIAVNGGGVLTVKFERNGYFPVQRKLSTTPQDYFSPKKTIMVRPSSKVTSVAINSTASQIITGSASSDFSGSRTPILLMPANTKASLKMPNGTSKELKSLSIRMTEYTVGVDGPNKMPASLPPTTSYTYAVELTADEAIANGASHVTFTNPVPLYVDNFLGFSPGTAIPVGTFNHATGSWDTENDGVVIKVLDLQNGIASLDISGLGQAASPQQLAALNITTDELQKIGTLYPSGKSFWRAQTNHFSLVDLNHATISDLVANYLGLPYSGPSTACPFGPFSCGSVIDVNSQALAERIDLPGVPASLNYTTITKPGRSLERELVIPVAPANFNIAAGVKSMHLKVEIEGQIFEKDYPSRNNITEHYIWDGKDAYGRTVNRTATAHITVDYEVSNFYGAARYAPGGQSFNQFRSDLVITGVPGREYTKYSKTFHIPVGNDQLPDAEPIGGWSLSKVHRYNPYAKKLYLGNGEIVDASRTTSIVSPVIGKNGGTALNYGDGDYALNAYVGLTKSIAIGPDGSIFLVDSERFGIRKVTPDGIIRTVVGTGQNRTGSAEGILGTLTATSCPNSLAVASDGTLFFADFCDQRIRKLTPDGYVFTVAGNGQSGSSGDNGPAVQAAIGSASEIVIGKDGTLYFASLSPRFIRKVSPSGIINRVAGVGGTSPSSGDDGNALLANLDNPTGMAIGPNNEIYYAEGSPSHKIRVITQDGIIRNFAGTTRGFSGDGASALLAQLDSPQKLDVADDGTVIFSDFGNGRIREITSDGKIRTIVGNGQGPGIAIGSGTEIGTRPAAVKYYKQNEKSFIFSEQSSNLWIRTYRPALPDYNQSGYIIPSQDASEIYHFSSDGIHLKTSNARTGVTKLSFTYDSNGRILSMTDGDQNITQISRDSSGRVYSIVGPFGHISSIALDSTGKLSSVTTPAGDKTEIFYNSAGLLSEFKNPKGYSTKMLYGNLGELLQETDPAGGIKNYIRAATDTGYKVTEKTGLNRSRIFSVDQDRDTPFYTTYNPDGSTMQQVADTTSNIFSGTGNDGRSFNYRVGIHPRLGGTAQTRVSGYQTVLGSLPTYQNTINFTPLSPTDDFKFIEKATVQFGSQNYVKVFDSTKLTETMTTSLGKTSSYSTDLQGRPIKFTSGNFLPVEISYSNRGQISNISQGDRITQFGYNNLGQMISKTNALGETENFVYDQSDRMTRKIRPDAKIIEFGYDSNSNLISIIPPEKLIHQFFVDFVDLFSIYKPPQTVGSGTTSYEYSLDKELLKITRADGHIISLGTEATTGLVKTISTSSKNITNTFSNGHLLSSVTSEGQTTSYTRTGGDVIAVSQIGLVQGTTQLQTSNGHVDRIFISTPQGNVPIDYTRDSDYFVTKIGPLVYGRNSATGLPQTSQMGSISESINYSTFGEMSQQNFSYNNSIFYQAIYPRDRLGRLSSKTETVLGNLYTNSYSYDSAGRLTDSGSNHYTYDGNGNRLSKNTVFASYDAQDRLIQFGNMTYSWSAHGDLIGKTNSDGTISVQYTTDDFGQLSAVTMPNKLVQYQSDANSQRIIKKLNGTIVQKFLYYPDGKLAAELNASNSPTAIFAFNEESHAPEYMIKNSVNYRFVKDQLGSIRLVVNSSTGEIAQRMDYDEFGIVLSDSNPGFQPFGFAGGIYDPDTKLVQFGARSYDPEIGRWISKDPIGFAGGDTNLYAYAGNDPINRIDPTGTIAPAVAIPVAIVGGAVIGGAAGFIGTIISTGSPKQAIGSIIPGAIGGITIVGGAIAGAIGAVPTGIGVGIGIATDIIINIGTAPGILPEGTGSDFGNGIKTLCNQK